MPQQAPRCPRCDNVLIGSAKTCVVHGDQLDVGGRAPALETVKDQRRVPAAVEVAAAPVERPPRLPATLALRRRQRDRA